MGWSKWAIAIAASLGVGAVIGAVAVLLLFGRFPDNQPLNQPPAADTGDSPAPPRDSQPNPVPSKPNAGLTPTPEDVATIVPTPPGPTPTLTAGQIFDLNDKGLLSDEEAAALLAGRALDKPISAPTIAPSKAIEPSAVPTVGPTSSTTLLPRESPGWVAALELEIHDLVNQERINHSLLGLTYDPSLSEVSRNHSQDMALHEFFSHSNLQGQSPSDRGDAAGYTCKKEIGGLIYTGTAETILQTWLFSSYTSTTRTYMTFDEIAMRIVDGWMGSPGQRENILTPQYTKDGVGIGIGADESVYVTQNFC